MTRILVDEEKGEVITKIGDNKKVYITDDYAMIRKKLSNKHFYKFYKNSVNIIYNNNVNYPVIKTLFKLVKMLKFKNEYLIISDEKANIKKIRNYLKIEERTFSNHLKVLEELEIIKRISKGKEKYIMINPFFISLGADITNEAIKEFCKTQWAKYLFVK